ncbi:unnamed protein product [Arctogadus glacialis]
MLSWFQKVLIHIVQSHQGHAKHKLYFKTFTCKTFKRKNAFRVYCTSVRTCILGNYRETKGKKDMLGGKGRVQISCFESRLGEPFNVGLVTHHKNRYCRGTNQNERKQPT